MTLFTYVAVDANQNVIKGNIDQPDKASVIALISKQGLRPISIKDTSTHSASSKTKQQISRKSTRVKRDKLVMFTRQLAAMIAAGVPLLRALSSLQANSDSQGLKYILGNVIKNIEGGMTFADALNKYPAVFDEIYVNMVRAGEAAGILDEILKRLALQQEKNASIRKKIRSAMIYPVTLLVVTVLAFFGLMLFVVPQIGKIIKDMGGANAELPAITQFMLGISDFTTKFWYVIIIIIAGLIFGFNQFIKTQKGRLIWDTILIKTPGVKRVTVKLAVARFTRTFSALMGAGVSVLECLRITSHSVGNVVFEKALSDAAIEVQNGKQLSAVIAKKTVFPPIVQQMMAVGEETGQTDNVLVKVADFYEEEVDVAVAGLSSIIEPVMIVIMGTVVGLVAASVMLPIASLAQNIK